MEPKISPQPQKTQHSLKWIDLIRLSMRNFTTKPSRTLLTILGTSVGIATVVVLVSLGYGLQNILMGKLITTPESLITLSASYPTDSNLVLNQTSTDAIAKIENVKIVSPVAEFPGSIQIGQGSGLALIRIVDENYTALSGNIPDVGKGIGKMPGVVVSTQALRLLDLPADASVIGKEISITAFYPSADGISTYDVSSKDDVTIIGIESFDKQPTVVVLNKSFSVPPPSFKEAYVEAQNDVVFDSLRSGITNNGFIISAHIDLVRQAQQVTNIITLILAIFGISALAVSAIGMFNTMIIGFLERTYEVGVMKALGSTDRDVERLFLMESLIMGVAGGLFGIILGTGLGGIFNFAISTFSTRLGGQQFALFVSPIWFLLLVMSVSAVIGLLAGFIPAHRASLLSPKEAFLRK